MLTSSNFDPERIFFFQKILVVVTFDKLIGPNMCYILFRYNMAWGGGCSCFWLFWCFVLCSTGQRATIQIESGLVVRGFFELFPYAKETGLFKSTIKHIQIVSQFILYRLWGGVLYLVMFPRPVQTDSGSLVENCFFSFSEYLFLTTLITFVSLFLAWLYNSTIQEEIQNLC